MPRSTRELQQGLGDQVRALRIAAGWSQADLADQISLSISSISRLEAGQTVNLSTLVKVARALGREDWLGDLNPVGPGPSPLEQLRMQRGQPARRSRVSRAAS